MFGEGVIGWEAISALFMGTDTKLRAFWTVKERSVICTTALTTSASLC